MIWQYTLCSNIRIPLTAFLLQNTTSCIDHGVGTAGMIVITKLILIIMMVNDCVHGDMGMMIIMLMTLNNHDDHDNDCNYENIQNDNAIDENNFDDDNCGNKDGDKTE